MKDLLMSRSCLWHKFLAGIDTGELQRLQSSLAKWAAMAAMMCASAGWWQLESLLTSLGAQAAAGARPELLPLMKVRFWNYKASKYQVPRPSTEVSSVMSGVDSRTFAVSHRSVLALEQSNRSLCDSATFVSEKSTAYICIAGSFCIGSFPYELITFRNLSPMPILLCL